MAQPEKKTSALLSEIKSAGSVEGFLRENSEQLKETDFNAYLTALCKQRGLSRRELFARAAIDSVYGYQIMAGGRTPSREYVLMLAFGLGADLDECRRLLTLAGRSQLYPRVPRDSAIIFCLYNGYGLQEAQQKLFELGMTTLGEIGSDNQRKH